MAQIRILLNGIELRKIELEPTTEYIVGRDESCSIRLDDPLISRKHLRLYNDGSQWRADKLSKFGKLIRGKDLVATLALDEEDSFLVPPFTFIISAAKPAVVSIEQGPPADSSKAAPFQMESTPEYSQMSSSDASKTAIQPLVSVFHMDEKTKIGDGETAQISVDGEIGGDQVPYLKVLTPDGDELLLRLAGESWILGRDKESAQIQIDDRKLSRKHLEISRSGIRFFVVDLGSTQGTTLNGKPLAANEKSEIFSQDEITAGQSTIVFEIRNPYFDQQVKSIPDDLKKPIENPMVPIDSADPALVQFQNAAGDHSDLPYFGSPNGMPAPYFGGASSPPQSRPKDRKKQKPIMIRGALVSAIVFLLYIGLSDKKEAPAPGSATNATKSPNQPQDPFEALTPDQKQLVQSYYNAGDTFMKRRNYEAALGEYEKINQMLPTGYEKSRTFEENARRAIEALSHKKEIEDVRRKEEEAKSKSEQIIAACAVKARTVKNVEVIQDCLAPAIELDPSNARAEEIIASVQKEIEDKAHARQVAATQSQLIKSGEELYKKAQAIAARSPLEGIKAYEAHIASRYPDPKNLKMDSKSEIQKIRSEIDRKVADLLKEAQDLQTNTKHRDAVARIDKALDMDPSNMPAKELRDQITSELFKKMKTIYGDSVLEESLGRTEEAKEKWRLILNTDIPTGEYHQKARIKMSKYGDK